MSKPLTLSYSGYNTFVECAHKFKLEKIDRISPIVQPSYFIFGSAVDKALNKLLEGGAEAEVVAELTAELDRLLLESIQFLEIDYDGEILSDTVKSDLLSACRGIGYSGDDVDDLARNLITRPHGDLSVNQRRALARCCYESLRAKALLMIEAYKLHVLPLIEKVEGVQQTINWTDDNGNAFTGVLDLPVTLKGYGSVIADNKTASRAYEPDAVKASGQLAIYSKVTGHTKAAFFVMEKKIKKNRIKTCGTCGVVNTSTHKTCAEKVDKKRCDGEFVETIKPEVNLQILVDDVSVTEQNIVQEAMSGVAEAVKKGAFPKNLKMCIQQFGMKKVRCPFYNHCRGGSMDGLKVREKSER